MDREASIVATGGSHGREPIIFGNTIKKVLKGRQKGGCISNKRLLALRTKIRSLQFRDAICDSIHHRFRGFWIEEDSFPSRDIITVWTIAIAGCKA